jgi:hypothetical protein
VRKKQVLETTRTKKEVEEAIAPIKTASADQDRERRSRTQAPIKTASADQNRERGDCSRRWGGRILDSGAAKLSCGFLRNDQART